MEEKLDGAVPTGELLFSSPVQEHHIDFLLEEEFACNPRFLNFFLKHGSKRLMESDGQRSRELHFPLAASECKVIRSVTTEDGETDVLVAFRAEDDQRWVALLIEDKIRASFQIDQAKRYRLRGDRGIRAGHWAQYLTCLVSPERYAVHNQDFDVRVSLEEIAAFFGNTDARSTFKREVMERALRDFASSGARIKDEKVTLFREFYAKQAAGFFSAEEITWEPPRDAWWGDTWFVFRRGVLPKGVSIFHKAGAGFVDLSFPHTNVSVLRFLISELDQTSDHRVEQTCKSASMRLVVPIIRDFTQTEGVVPELEPAFSAVGKLLSFYKKHAKEIGDRLPSPID